MHTQHSAAQREALRTSDTAVRLLPREAAIVEGDGIGNVNESVVVDLGSTDRHRELRNTTGGGVACTNLMAASTAQQDALVAVDDRVADSEVGAQLVVEVDGLHSWRAQECLLGVTDANEGVVDELAPCKPTAHGVAGESSCMHGMVRPQFLPRCDHDRPEYHAPASVTVVAPNIVRREKTR